MRLGGFWGEGGLTHPRRRATTPLTPNPRLAFRTTSSVATEWVKGRSVHDVLGIKNTDIASHLKLPPVKLHCRCALAFTPVPTPLPPSFYSHPLPLARPTPGLWLTQHVGRGCHQGSGD